MLEVGKTASFSKTISESDVYMFAGITGDFNSLHVNEVEAQKSSFGSRVAHGMLTGSFISTVLGTKLPGEGTIYMEQNLKFRKPVYINDTISVNVTVSEVINIDKGIYKLDTVIVNSDNDIVTEGYAIVMYKGDMCA